MLEFGTPATQTTFCHCQIIECHIKLGFGSHLFDKSNWIVNLVGPYLVKTEGMLSALGWLVVGVAQDGHHHRKLSPVIVLAL